MLINAFFEKQSFKFGWAICFKWQITELMLNFIPNINGFYSDSFHKNQFCKMD